MLIRCYHGLGDTLQFARFLPIIGARAASLHVEMQPALIPLLEQVPGPDRLIPFKPAMPARPRDCDIEIMELLQRAPRSAGFDSASDRAPRSAASDR